MKTTPDWQFESSASPDRGAALGRFARLGLALSLLNLLVFVAAPLARLHLDIPGRLAFQVSGYALLFGLALAGIGLLLFVLGIFIKSVRGWPVMLLILFGAAPAAAVIIHTGPAAYRGVLLHDISTDTADPPEFVVVAKQRRPGDNSAVYGGSDLAAQQRAAYPNLGPITSTLNYDDALSEATQAVKDLGWEFINVDFNAGIIEAYDTSPVFGLVDDIVIRVRREGRGTRIDIRSAARYYSGEPGVQAERIRQFAAVFRG